MTGWETVRLSGLLREIDDRGHADLEVLSVYRDLGVVPKASRDDNFNKTPQDLTSYKRVRVGDLVVNKMKAWSGSLAISNFDGIVSGDYMVCAVTGAVERRFLHHLLRSKLVFSQIAALSTGIRPSQWRLYWDDLRQVAVRLPPIAAQRAIAEYLDAETARVDAVVAKRNEMIRALEEREQAALLSLVGDWRSMPTVTLRQLGTAVLTGPFGTQLAASEYVDNGVPIVNPTHIKSGRVTPDPQTSVPERVAERLSRHRLRLGDLVVGRKGDVGHAAIITEAEDGWICGSDSIAIRTKPKLLRADFLALVLRVGLYRQQLVARSTGAMMANVNESNLLGLQVPVAAAQQQVVLVGAGLKLLERGQAMGHLQSRQINLLTERRQALITAAVTGQVDIPGIAA